MSNQGNSDKNSDEFDNFVKDLQNQIDTKVYEDYSLYALELAENPYKYGILPSDEISIQKKKRGSCGDSVTFYLKINNDRIEDIRYETDGCTTSSIATSQTTKMVDNKTVEEALQLTDKQVLDALGKFPEDSYHCATLAVDTLHLALNEYIKLKNKNEK
ncbi:MAG: iron-sulfur cluster assembly scaffold protein [Promethearchaeota archaeon]